MNLYQNSPIEQITFHHQRFYIKRDDLLHQDFSGNKARKLYYYIQHDFPNIKRVVSYGSIQSNAMFSLSVLANMRGWEFYYIVDHIPNYLLENPQGNYKYALEKGMKIVWSREDIKMDKQTLWIEEGARDHKAQYGINVLAREILTWYKAKAIKNLAVVLPSGTGTTALFLQKYLYPYTIKVYTTPCVGDYYYLVEQFKMLEEDERYYPCVLSLDRKYHFGKLYKNNYLIWKELKEYTSIEFDLLYDPKGWLMIQQHQAVFKNKTVLYIHQGGTIGNESMLPRYQRKFTL
jgi:1-aminocyclopropane-1-carboxylate deaminase/D-cysteine desulfhydrase-like pyridoxal-dependent ACC family enzyme